MVAGRMGRTYSFGWPAQCGQVLSAMPLMQACEPGDEESEEMEGVRLE